MTRVGAPSAIRDVGQRVSRAGLPRDAVGLEAVPGRARCRRWPGRVSTHRRPLPLPVDLEDGARPCVRPALAVTVGESPPSLSWCVPQGRGRVRGPRPAASLRGLGRPGVPRAPAGSPRRLSLTCIPCGPRGVRKPAADAWFSPRVVRRADENSLKPPNLRSRGAGGPLGYINSGLCSPAAERSVPREARGAGAKARAHPRTRPSTQA